jgi:hypothetical protein
VAEDVASRDRGDQAGDVAVQDQVQLDITAELAQGAAVNAATGRAGDGIDA